MDGKNTYLQLSGYFILHQTVGLPARLRLQQALRFIHFLRHGLPYGQSLSVLRTGFQRILKETLSGYAGLVLFLVFFWLMFLFGENARLLFDERLFDLVSGFLVVHCVRVRLRPPEEGMEVAKLAESVYFSKRNARGIFLFCLAVLCSDTVPIKRNFRFYMRISLCCRILIAAK